MNHLLYGAEQHTCDASRRILTGCVAVCVALHRGVARRCVRHVRYGHQTRINTCAWQSNALDQVWKI